MAFIGDTYRINSLPDVRLSTVTNTDTAFSFKYVDANGDNVNMATYAGFSFVAYKSSVNTTPIVVANVSNITGTDGQVSVYLDKSEVNVTSSAYQFILKGDSDALATGTLHILNAP